MRDDPPPLRGLRFAVAGPGRVGRSLTRWAVDRGAELELVVRRAGSPDAAVSRKNEPCKDESFEEVSFDRVADLGLDEQVLFEPLDLMLLTVSDDALGPIARRWARAIGTRPDGLRGPAPFAVVLHSSGSLDAEVLAPLRGVGVAVGSLHPLRAFAEVIEQPGTGSFFAVDGDADAARLARRLVAAWNGTCCDLSGHRRVVYHLAASLAAGGVVTVLAAVAQLMQDAGLPEELLEGYLRLLRGAVEVAGAEGRPSEVAPSITGPAARGDTATLRRHLAALRATSPEVEPLVRALWHETHRQTGQQTEWPAGDGEAPADP